MKIGRAQRTEYSSKRTFFAAVAMLAMMGSLLACNVSADPAADALARLNELSRKAEQTTEAMHSAQLDLDAKLAAHKAAEARKATDEAALAAAKEELTKYQTAVHKVTATIYMGGRSDGVSAVLTADSPQRLIDQLSVERAMATEMADTMRAFQSGNQRAITAARASSTSADAARAAAEHAAAVRAELQSKQSELKHRIAAVQSQYEALTPDQRAVLADPGPPPPPIPAAPVPPDPAIIAMPDQPPVDAAVPLAAPNGDGAAVVQAAMSRIGAPHSWGATGPNAFDCSGLIKWAFLQNGKSFPRSSQALAQAGQPVAVSDLQLGDIVTFYSDVSHAGIYIGDGMMVHASTFGTPVKVAPISSAPIHLVGH